MQDNIVFLISAMNGAGAERVVSLLSKCLVDNGKNVSIIITSKKLEESDLTTVDKRVCVYSLAEMIDNKRKFMSRLIMLLSKVLKSVGIRHYSAILKYYARNYNRIKALKTFYRNKKTTTVIAFLYDAMFLSLLTRKKIKLVISERADPCQLLSNETDAAFIYKMFYRADKMVFQSPDVLKWYRENTKACGTVIFNPVIADLPLSDNKRNNEIVNFCRITEQKNLIMLIRAFKKLNNNYPDYILTIYGNDDNSGYIDKVIAEIDNSAIAEKINLYPAQNDIHRIVKDCAMFVSSSDYEGMSNSMLEAMAMGMPVVCTDCPAGGARAVIKDHENGLLTPVGDAEALYRAMKEIIENPALAKKLGENAAKIREEQSVEKITEKWMEVLS